jgi:Coenzyme PQQ synthesis protein D (PqqD)
VRLTGANLFCRSFDLAESISKKGFYSGSGLCLMRLAIQQDMGAHILFKIDRPRVICQSIEGEAVVINLQTGTYYSLTGAAATIWDELEHGAAASQITDTLAAHFTDCDAGLENIVAGFLEELRGESLIVPAENLELIASGGLNDAPVKREKFVRPVLKKFTDMQELLLLDPIHEVDATGWPLAKPDPNHDADK